MNIVLFGTYNPEEVLTGPEKFAKRVYEELTDPRDTVTFLTYFQDGAKYGWREKIFGKRSLYGTESHSVVQIGVVPLISFFARRRIDIVHIMHFQRFAILALLAKYVFRFKVVYTVHSIVQFEYKNYRRTLPRLFRTTNSIIERIFLQNADAIVFVSGLVRELHKSMFVPRRLSAVIPNAVDDCFRFQNRSPVSSERLSIVFVGDPSKKIKGFDSLLELLGGLSVPASVYIVAEKKFEINVSNPNAQVIFTLKMSAEEYSRFLSDKDVFLSMSEFDAFSISAAEAMAAGVVPIVTRSTGLTAYITHAQNGFIVERGDIAAFDSILCLLYSNIELRKGISMRCREGMKDLTWKRVAKEYRELYDKVR